VLFFVVVPCVKANSRDVGRRQQPGHVGGGLVSGGRHAASEPALVDEPLDALPVDGIQIAATRQIIGDTGTVQHPGAAIEQADQILAAIPFQDGESTRRASGWRWLAGYR
jgi:hypothetical protein